VIQRFEGEFAPARLQATWRAILATFSVGGRSERQTFTSYLENIISLKAC
jgi:hypothetical protein